MSRKTLGAKRVAARAMAVGAGAVLVAGCQFGGINSLRLPGTVGHGPGSYKITVELPDVATLPQNSPVMFNDVTVGSVSGIDAVQRADGTFYARVQLSLSRDVDLPANAVARVAQTSLLGSQHVELSAPADKSLERSDRYPTTEEVLAALGVVVNNGNLGALQDITNEAYAAVAGRTASFVDLVPRLAQFTTALNQQTNDIIAAAEGVNRFAGILARNTDSLSRALETMPDALRVLNDNRSHIVDAFAALQSFATVAARILSETKEDFAADLKDLYPVIKALNDVRYDLSPALDLIPTFPITTSYVQRTVRGDYANVFVTFDLTVRRLGESLLTTSSFDPNMTHLQEVINPPDWLIGETSNLSGQAADPFKIPPGTASGQDEVPR